MTPVLRERLSRTRRRRQRHQRRGVVVVLVAVMGVVLLGMAAFAVDYGYLLKMRTDLQRAADASALAAVQTLVPSPTGVQDLDGTRTTARAYANMNLQAPGGAQSFNVTDGDIEIGRYDPDTIYTNVTLLNDGIFDSVRVTLRRDGVVNARVPLFFGRAIGIDDTQITVTATAVLQKPNVFRPGNDVLPFAIPRDLWNSLDPGDTFTGYGDGKVRDPYGSEIPGNWGTLDIGAESNSTSSLDYQIQNGLVQGDIDALYQDHRIPQDTHIDGDQPVWMQADTGISGGLKAAVRAIYGQQRIVPIYDSLTGSVAGNNLEYRVTGWGVVTVGDSRWNGANNTWVQLQRSYLYDGDLAAKPNSLDDTPSVEGAFGAPVLVE